VAKAPVQQTKALTDGKAPAPGAFNATAALAQSRAITDQDFYEIERYDRASNGYIKVKKPNARALQFEANNSGMGGIATEIVESGIDEVHAWARVKGWPVNTPTFVKEDQVTIVWDLEVQQLLFDRIDKGCQLHKAGCPLLLDANNQPILGEKTGLPILKDSREQMAIIKQVLRTKRFGDRTCITKAEARLHEKFLNIEWRDSEEIEHEASEIAIVADARKAEKPAEPPAVKNKPVEQAAAPAAAAPAAAPAAQTAPKAAPAPKAAEKPKAPAPAPAAAPPAGTPPRANIPPLERPAAAAPAQPPATAKPKNAVQERVTRLALTTACSTTHWVDFLKKTLNVADIKNSTLEQVMHVLAAAEATIASGIAPSGFGAYVRGDAAPAEVSERFENFLKGGA
jgi:hypothetical protein